MKKLLGVSFIAMLAVSPMMAMAAGELSESVATATANMGTVAAHSGAGNNLATGAFVQGAYNEALGYIKSVNASVATLNESILPAIQTNAVNGAYSASSTYDDGTIGAAIKSLNTSLGDYVTSSSLGTAAFTDSTAYASAAGLSAVEGNISTIEGNISTIEGNISTIEGNISTIEGNISTIEGNISTIEGNISTIEGDISAINSALSGLDSALDDVYTKSAADAKFATQGGVVNTIKSASVSIPLDVYTTWATNDTSPTTLSSTVSVASYVPEDEEEGD